MFAVKTRVGGMNRGKTVTNRAWSPDSMMIAFVARDQPAAKELEKTPQAVTQVHNLEPLSKL
jgi:hypothetical protein